MNRLLAGSLFAFLAFFALLLSMPACGSKSDEGGGSTEDRRRAMLNDLLAEVIRPELAALRSRSATFAEQAATFCDEMEPSSADHFRLEALRKTWRDLRGDWRRNEVWMVGPIAEELGPKRLNAPLDADRFAAAKLAFRGVNDAAAARERAAGLGAGAKGQAAVAALVFEEPGGPDLAGRHLLAALADEQRDLMTRMTAPWLDEAGALATALRDPGAGRVFETRKEAVDALLVQAVVLAMRTRDEDLAPLVGATAKGVVQSLPAGFDGTQQHRRDLLETYLGLQQFYLGRHAGRNGPGLASLVAPRSEAVARVAPLAFEKAVAAMAALPEDVDAAGADADVKRQAAYDAATLVKAQLGTSIVALLDTTLGFALADGD